MIKKWMDKYYGGAINFRERLLRIILSLSIAVSGMAVVAGICIGSRPIVLLPLVLMTAVSFLSFRLVCRYRKVGLAVWVMDILINIFLFPLMYFLSGGMGSGATVWFVLGLVYIFLLFTGASMYAALLLEMAVLGTAYFLSWKHPDWVIPMESTGSAHIDSLLAVLMVGIAIGIIFKFYVRMYEQERKKGEEQRAEIESISQSKSAFFANMSHEIRTPINTIIGLNEMTLREDISDEIAENAVNIQNASKMLLALINDILDMSKMESGKMEIVPTQYETGALFSDLVNIIWIRMHEKNLEFKIDISRHLPSMLYGDEVRLKQVLANILTNAVKYTEKGSVTLTAQSDRIDANRILLKITVADTGIGIKKESLEDLFSSFRRVDQERNRKIEGTGLGLSISKQLIEMMGGKITVDSIYTKGSTFTVTVEQQVVNPMPVGTMDFMVKRKLYEREKYKQSFEAPEAKVLIVDDNEMNLMVACKLLRSTKVQIDTAKSGKECLEKTNSRFYHVIFMDHMMPDMDGEETLHGLKKQDKGHCQNVPVIALTANVMAGAEEIYQEKGFAGYLAKPINGVLFEATLLKFLPHELIEYSVYEEDGEEEGSVQTFFSAKKKKLSITADCVCDLPGKWLEQFEVTVMYYYVYTKQGRFSDQLEISSDNLLKYMQKAGSEAHSSAPPPEEYETFFADALEKAEKVIHISMASHGGNGYRSASAAAKGFDNVTVVDSGHLSSGMGIMVLHAAQMAQEGKSVEEICGMLAKLKDKISTSFIVPSPENLYRCGKVSKRVRDICEHLSLHPVLHLSQSKIRLRGVETGSVQTAYRRYIRHLLWDKKSIDTRILFLTYAGCSLEQLEEIKKEIKKYVFFDHIEVQKASATISSNCGIGSFGLLFMKKKKKR